MTKEKIKDFTYRVTTANKTELIVILYDIAESYIEDAISDIEKADYKGCREEIGHVRSTIRELMNSVDTSQEIGQNLLKLYIFCSEQLTKAFIDYDKNALYHVLSVIKKLREAYDKVSVIDKSEPVMQNAEKVYNGFSYNKNMMTENLAEGNFNRGFLV